MTPLKLLLIALTLAVSLRAAENVKAVGPVAKANIKAVGPVAEANVKAVGPVDNTAAGGGGIVWNELTQGTSTTATFDTASITPTANAQVFVAIARANSAAPAPASGEITVSGCNLTWVEVAHITYASRRALFVFRGTGASPTTDNVTITDNGSNFQEYLYSVDEATGVNSGTPIGTPQENSTAGATSLATPDVGTIDAGDYVYAAFSREDATAITPDVGTTLTTISSGTNVRSLVVFHNTTDDTPSVTYNVSDEGAGIGFTVETQ